MVDCWSSYPGEMLTISISGLFNSFILRRNSGELMVTASPKTNNPPNCLLHQPADERTMDQVVKTKSETQLSSYSFYSPPPLPSNVGWCVDNLTRKCYTSRGRKPIIDYVTLRDVISDR